MFKEAHELGHVHGAVVLPAQQRLQDRAGRLPRCRPTSPGRPTTSASPSRPTSSSRSCPENNGGYNAFSGYGKTYEAGLRGADDRPPDRPLPLAGGQLLHGPDRPHQLAAASPRAQSDLADAVRTAVINKRAGGMGLISGRKAFQRPMGEGVELLQAIQDVYLDTTVTLA